MKFLAMHITNQKWSFYIFTVGYLQYIFMEHLYLVKYLMIFGIIFFYNFDQCFLAIVTNIPQQFKTSVEVQGHI